jgi:hypothetical protein
MLVDFIQRMPIWARSKIHIKLFVPDIYSALVSEVSAYNSYEIAWSDDQLKDLLICRSELNRFAFRQFDIIQALINRAHEHIQTTNEQAVHFGAAGEYKVTPRVVLQLADRLLHYVKTKNLEKISKDDFEQALM